MVPCTTHADCYRKCPRHPLTGSHYVCQTRFSLFDFVNTTDDNRVAYWNASDGAAATLIRPPATASASTATRASTRAARRSRWR